MFLTLGYVARKAIERGSAAFVVQRPGEGQVKLRPAFGDAFFASDSSAVQNVSRQLSMLISWSCAIKVFERLHLQVKFVHQHTGLWSCHDTFFVLAEVL